MKNNDNSDMTKNLFVEKGFLGDISWYSYGDIIERLSLYMIGYKEAADIVVKKALEMPTIGTKDSYLFPVVFLYRHYFELRLKYLYLSLSEETNDEKSNAIKDINHSLKKAWYKAKPLLRKEIMNRGSKERVSELIKTIELFVDEFHRFDSNSFTYRYPINKTLNNVHKGETTSLNLQNLSLQMDFLDSLFWGIENEFPI